MENDRVSRHPLRLSRMGGAAQRTCHLAAGFHQQSPELVALGRGETRAVEVTDGKKTAARKTLSSSGSDGPGRSWRTSCAMQGSSVVAIERGPWRDTASGIFAVHARRTNCAIRIRHELFSAARADRH